ncbi:MAG: hypothetical protein IT576_21075 [Verrucomicrobiales bacterium]|nr:hypothetical protein [Verrucomicrobiales bacterium]
MKQYFLSPSLILGTALALVIVPMLPAQDDAADLAKQLQNPVAALISVPFQSNFDWGGGPDGDGFQCKLNIQPVVPFGLNDDWNLISRTILPYIYQEDVIGRGSQSGLSDTVQSLFFSPKAPTSTGWIWGAGPVFLIPTATDDLLGGEKWGAGPTALILRQEKGWTYGILANHLWSYAGEDAREEVNATFLQPFLSFTSLSQTTLGLNLESTYDWERGQWTVPVNLALSQLVKIGGAPVQFQLGGRYYAEGPGNAPEWGLRFGVTLLFPK